MSVAKSYTPLIPMPGMSGYLVRAPVHSTRFRAVKRRPSTSTVWESMILAGVFRMNSMSSCSLDCQFMMACGYIRPGLEQVDDLLDAGPLLVERRVPQAPGHVPGQVHLPGRLGEQVMRHAGLVRAGAAQEGPRVDGELRGRPGPSGRPSRTGRSRRRRRRSRRTRGRPRPGRPRSTGPRCSPPGGPRCRRSAGPTRPRSAARRPRRGHRRRASRGRRSARAVT